MVKPTVNDLGGSDPMTQAKFLSVGIFEQRLSKTQAREILAEQRQRAQHSFPTRRVGEVGVELGILTADSSNFILAQQALYVSQNRPLPDFLDGNDDLPITPHTLKKLACVILAISMLAVWVLTRNWTNVATVAGIGAALYLVVENFQFAISRGRIVWQRIPAFSAAIAFPTALFFIVDAARALGQLGATGRATPSAVRARIVQLIVWQIVLAAVSVFFALIGAWRHREIWMLEARSAVIHSLVTRAYLGLTELKRGKNVPPTLAKDYAEELMNKAATVMRLNPWEDLLRKLLFWVEPIGAVSLWYLEPEPELKSFRIKMYKAPTAPQEALAAFDLIGSEHRPAWHDEARYLAQIRRLSTSGHLHRALFINEPQTRTLTSLAGFVFARRTSITTGNLNECLVFNRSYLDAVNKIEVTNSLRGWLNFTSGAAYPVFRDGDDTEALGVLMAFKNTRNGFTPEDKTVMVTSARLLGLLLSVENENGNGTSN